MLGINLRTYDSKKKSWNIKWLNALGGTWVDLGTEESGGVKIDEKGGSRSMLGENPAQEPSLVS